MTSDDHRWAHGMDGRRVRQVLVVRAPARMTINDEILIDPKAGDAVLEAYFAFERLDSATTLAAQSAAFVDLSNAMSDVASWLPGYDPETGEVGEQP